MTQSSSSEGLSPRRLARVLGVVGLLGILTGAFDIGYVQTALIVDGDPAATLHNIAAHQVLFCQGLTAHVFELVLNVPGEIIAFVLLRRVNAIAAGISIGCGVIGISIEAVSLLAAYLPLQLAGGGGALAGLSARQVGALSSLSLQLQQAGLLLSWVFYGLDEFASGFLIFRSRFLPRVIGLLLGLSGLCYFTHGMLSFLAPALDARLMPYILLPCFPGEALSSLWLATMGLNVETWKSWLAEPPALAAGATRAADHGAAPHLA
jgi:hypothetical protein